MLCRWYLNCSQEVTVCKSKCLLCFIFKILLIFFYKFWLKKMKNSLSQFFNKPGNNGYFYLFKKVFVIIYDFIDKKNFAVILYFNYITWSIRFLTFFMKNNSPLNFKQRRFLQLSAAFNSLTAQHMVHAVLYSLSVKVKYIKLLS